MHLLRTERVLIGRRVMDALWGRDGAQAWSPSELEFLLKTYDLDSVDLDDRWAQELLASRIADVSDATLLEIYEVTTGKAWENSASPPDSSEIEGIWKAGYVRAFLSHSSDLREAASGAAGELAIVGVDAFVAHRNVKVSKPWQDEIERALRSAEFFIGLADARFQSSVWCQQELGWALGRSIPVFLVRLSASPLGFVASTQWPELASFGAKEVAAEVTRWLSSQRDLGPRVCAGLFEALRRAQNYYDAEAAAKRIDALGYLSEEQFLVLDEIYLTNNQVGGGVLANRALKPLYDRHERSLPGRRQQLDRR